MQWVPIEMQWVPTFLKLKGSFLSDFSLKKTIKEIILPEENYCYTCVLIYYTV